ETDGYAFVPTSHRVVRRDRILRQLFDLRDPLVVVLDGAAPGSALRCSFLRRLTRLTESIRTGPDVDPGSVTSLATLRRVAPEGRESVIVPALASRSDPGDGCEERRGFAGGTTPYAGILVARDHSAAAVLAALNPDVDRG